ncbi:MAG: class I tRNA ligase family protein, partial [Thermoplasmata archaeon]
TGPSGAKLSKKEISSKGGRGTGGARRIPPIDQALARWGPDALRLYYTNAAAASSEVAWSSEGVDAALARLEDIERLLGGTRGSARGPPELDAWLLSKMHRLIARVRTGFAAADLRSVAEEVYVGVPSLLRRYHARGGEAGATTEQIGRAWVLLLAPITPHLAEEVGAGRFPGLVATEPFPRADEFPLSVDGEAREEYLDRVEEDLRAVLRPHQDRAAPSPEEVVFFIAAAWKTTVEGWMREAVDRGESPTLHAIMERVQRHPELTAHRAEVPKYVQRVGLLLRAETGRSPGPVDEGATLRAAEGYLVRRFGFRSVKVVDEAEGEASDPRGRRERSRPGIPAFYLVGPDAAPEP